MSTAWMPGWAAGCSALALAAAVASCQPASAPGGGPELAPYPFTVYQLRAGCPSGRMIEYRFEEDGKAPHVERWSFQDADPQSVSVTTTTFDDNGTQVGEPVTERATWAALHEHARFPYSSTVIDSEPITLPPGQFETMRYVVTRGGEVTTYWFARSLPGPPVRIEVVKEGKTVRLMTMQANLSKPRATLVMP